MVPPPDKQHDAGQFNAWLTNLGPSKGGARPMPQRPPGAAARPGPGQAPPTPPAKQGGLLGSVDDELDDIFGRITTEEAPQLSPPQTPPAAPRPAPIPQAQPRPAQEVPRPPARPQPAPPPPRPQQAAMDALLARARQAAEQQRPPQPPVARPPMPQAPMPRPQARMPEPPVPQYAEPPVPQYAETAPAQDIGAQVEAAVAEARASMQAQIKELQAKYQEQRQKWERLLSELRVRNDELHRQNQGLEEELAALRDRQRSLIMELSTQRATPQPINLAPQPEEKPQPAAEPAFRQQPGEEVREAPAPEISIEAPQPSGGFAGGQPEATFEIPLAKPEEPATGEADDLLAELDALEKEMKNLGGEGQG